MNEYYVYCFDNPLTGQPFYIGKGKGARLTWWRYANLSKQYGVYPKLKSLKEAGLQPVVRKLLMGLTEKESFFFERFFIAALGRRSEGTGVLLNLSSGGEGSAGIRISRYPTLETREKISTALRGIPFTESHKKNLSAALLIRLQDPATRDKMRLSALKRWKLAQNSSCGRRSGGHGRSQYKGVYPRRRNCRACIYVNNMQVYLGTFPIEIDAARAYNVAVDKYLGGIGWKNRVDVCPEKIPGGIERRKLANNIP